MFELDIEMLKEQGLQLVDSAKKTAQDLADKGKNKLDLLNQQARLSKAQRQLGALVYSLHKAGEENPALVEKYIDAVAEVEKAIEEIKASYTVKLGDIIEVTFGNRPVKIRVLSDVEQKGKDVAREMFEIIEE